MDAAQSSAATLLPGQKGGDLPLSEGRDTLPKHHVFVHNVLGIMRISLDMVKLVCGRKLHYTCLTATALDPVHLFNSSFRLVVEHTLPGITLLGIEPGDLLMRRLPGPRQLRFPDAACRLVMEGSSRSIHAQLSGLERTTARILVRHHLGNQRL